MIEPTTLPRAPIFNRDGAKCRVAEYSMVQGVAVQERAV